MLCNRPNELGQVQKSQPPAHQPFNSRVKGFNDIGLNPAKRVMPVRKKKIDPNSILFRHRRYLKQLEQKKAELKVQEEQKK